MRKKNRVRLRQWVRGIIGGAIGSGANGLTVMIVDPVNFNLTSSGGVQKLLMVMGVSAAVGAAMWLKNHPLPDDDDLIVPADAPPVPVWRCPTCGGTR